MKVRVSTGVARDHKGCSFLGFFTPWAVSPISFSKLLYHGYCCREGTRAKCVLFRIKWCCTVAAGGTAAAVRRQMKCMIDNSIYSPTLLIHSVRHLSSASLQIQKAHSLLAPSNKKSQACSTYLHSLKAATRRNPEIACPERIISRRGPETTTPRKRSSKATKARQLRVFAPHPCFWRWRLADTNPRGVRARNDETIEHDPPETRDGDHFARL